MNKVMVRTMIDKHIDMLMGLSEMAYSWAKEAGMSEIITASQVVRENATMIEQLAVAQAQLCADEES